MIGMKCKYAHVKTYPMLVYLTLLGICTSSKQWAKLTIYCIARTVVFSYIALKGYKFKPITTDRKICNCNLCNYIIGMPNKFLIDPFKTHECFNPKFVRRRIPAAASVESHSG